MSFFRVSWRYLSLFFLFTHKPEELVVDKVQNLLTIFNSNIFIALARESFLRGKDQYGWPPSTNWFISAPFYFENFFTCFYKTSYSNEEVN